MNHIQNFDSVLTPEELEHLKTCDFCAERDVYKRQVQLSASFTLAGVP